MSKIAIPIERKMRERDGKIWLSMNLAAEGHEVILGKRHHLYERIKEIQPDFILHFKANKSSIDKFKKWKDMGIYIGVLETEGGVWDNQRQFINNRCVQEALDNVDIYFAWGNKQKNNIMKNRHISNIIVSGNPRFDLTREPMRNIYSGRAKNISSSFGEFVLFNGNFGLINHGVRSHKKQKELLKKRYSDELVEKRLENEKELFGQFFEAVKYLAKEGLNVVVRPHQTENINRYQDEFNDSNINIELSGDVREWIIASKAVVHNSCTTGIESVMLDVPTYSYQPVKIDSRPDLPNKISDNADTKEVLLEKINSQKWSPTKKQYKMINDYFNRYENKNAAGIISSFLTRHKYEANEEMHDKSFMFNVSDLKRNVKDLPGSPILKKGYYCYLENMMNIDDRLYLDQKEVNETVNELQPYIDDQIQANRMYNWDDIYLVSAHKY